MRHGHLTRSKLRSRGNGATDDTARDEIVRLDETVLICYTRLEWLYMYINLVMQIVTLHSMLRLIWRICPHPLLANGLSLRLFF